MKTQATVTEEDSYQSPPKKRKNEIALKKMAKRSKSMKKNQMLKSQSK
jgi:hypothetical protein